MSNLTRRDIWEDAAKFYFLPFLTECYRFTRQHKLPYFTLMVSPTMMIYRDRLHLRNFIDTIHQTFFKTMEMCGLTEERIMLLVEKRFHIINPVDGGTQQLYNMLWDVDLLPEVSKCYLPPKNSPNTSWDMGMVNPGMKNDVWLSRGTLWLEDDLEFLGKKYALND